MTDGFAELDTVALCRDLPDAGLRVGDLGAVVHVYPGAVEVEFVTVAGRTQALVTLADADVRPIRDNDVPRRAFHRSVARGRLTQPPDCPGRADNLVRPTLLSRERTREPRRLSGRGMYLYETARTENDKVPAASGKQPAASFTATEPFQSRDLP